MVRGTPKVTAQLRKFVGDGIWVRLNRAPILLRLFPSYDTISHTHIYICVYVCGPPWWLSSKVPSTNAEDAGLISDLRRFPGEGNGDPLLGIPMDR